MKDAYSNLKLGIYLSPGIWNSKFELKFSVSQLTAKLMVRQCRDSLSLGPLLGYPEGLFLSQVWQPSWWPVKVLMAHHLFHHLDLSFPCFVSILTVKLTAHQCNGPSLGTSFSSTLFRSNKYLDGQWGSRRNMRKG